MKTLTTVLICFISFNIFSTEIDFDQIFKEIQNAKTSTESISIRYKYLDQIKSLSDFDQLSNFEYLEEGENFFEHYKKALGQFVFDNIDMFMNKNKSAVERKIYALNIVNKAYDYRMRSEFIGKGLFYVYDCKSFKSYTKMVEASRHFKRVNAHRYCNPNAGETPYTFELASNIILRDGEFKIINLSSVMKISKLYISVEGIKNSTFFDVIVNGDTKGTIYAPGSDPLFIVNIADSISLRSLSGSALIKSIKVEVN